MKGRRALIIAALGFAHLDADVPELGPLRRWLDSWAGLGAVVVGMMRQGYRLHLTNVDADVWRATFSGASRMAQDGFGAASTPWRAVQAAAWAALWRRRREQAR